MHDGEDLVPPKRIPHRSHVGDVAFDERTVLDRLAMSGDQVVVDDDAIAAPG